MILQLIAAKLKRLLAIERKRYQKKGIANTIAGLIILFGMVWLTLFFGKRFWPNQINNKQMFVLIGSIICYYTTQTICLLFYLPGYKWQINFVDRHVIKRMNFQMQTYNIPARYQVIIKNLIVNQLLLLPISVYFLFKNNITIQLNQLPGFSIFFKEILIMHFAQDFLGFLGHKMSHSLSFFSKTHKIHHDFNKIQWWVSEYFHPLEPACASYIMALAINFGSGNSVHCIVIFFWICWKNIVNTQNHAGYQFQWSPTRVLPFIADPSYHLYHHDHYMENYAATCYVWDLLTDTNIKYIDRFLTT